MKGITPWNKTSSVRQCLNCNKEYLSKYYQLKKGYGRYCSSKCFGTSLKKEKIQKTCIICLVLFSVYPSQKNAIYCSRICYSKKQKIKNAQCKICGISFYIRPIKKKKNGNSCSKKCQNISNIGKPTWNKGKPFLAVRGSKNPNWKGGVTLLREQLRKSLEYENWRKSILERDLYTCQWCYQIGGYLEVDHIKPWSLFPELRFNIANGRTLCHDCHTKTDSYLNCKMKREDFE